MMEPDVPSEQTFYVYDGSTLLGEVAAGANEPTPTVTAAYTWGADGLVSEHLFSPPDGEQSRASLWYHFGPQGETRQLTDESGSVADAYSYTAYGAATGVSGYGDPNPFRYGGQFGYYAPFASNFYLCGLRWYDGDAGRFLSRDPIGYDGGDNLYAYCGGDPVNEADPSGLAGDADPCPDSDPSGRSDIEDDAAVEKWFPALAKASGNALKDAYDWSRDTVERYKKRGPRRWPNGPHNQKIQQRINELTDQGMKHVRGGNKPEQCIDTPLGAKSSRRPDITMLQPDGSLYWEQVGRVNGDGSPVARERQALEDLNLVKEPGGTVVFTAYFPPYFK